MIIAEVPAPEPIAVHVKGAMRLSGLGTTKLYELIREKKLESVKIDGRRLILYRSLKRLFGVD